MNEQIKQLAEQAAISCGYFIGPRLYMTHEKEMEKFAELIVRDCIALANKYAAGGAGSEFDVGYISCANALAEEMKEHFGVE